MRYTGEPKRLYDFMETFAIVCPKCEAKAEVQLPHFLDYKNAQWHCPSCFFSEKMSSLIRYVYSGKAKCSECLNWLDLGTEPFKKIPKYTNIRCSSCDTINKVSENLTIIYQKYQTGRISDPAFGLPLWYTDEVKGEEIWAFNLQHLLEIKDYVGSKLRERTTDRFKMTMVEKLPDFIKSAKNREEVLKAIERMEKK
ncbi:MAG: hypothetical protein IPN79_12670 [Saprospiraceae bacterium]|nr:hypothetical protein [Saprospiraceae bacterium]